MKKATLALTVLLAVGLVGFALAGPGYMKGLASGKMAEKLDLTEDQQAKIEDLRYENQKKKIDLQADMRKTQLEMKHEMQKDNVDREKVMKLVEESGELKIQLRKAQVQQMLDVKDVLTPEQREEAKEMMGKWRKSGGMRSMHGKRGGGCGQGECPMKEKMEKGEGRKEHGMMRRGMHDYEEDDE